MRALVLPGNNALSHVTKALAVIEELESRGHEPVMAVARGRRGFLERLEVPFRLLPDIQETNCGPSPSFAWFKPGVFASVVSAEVALMEEVKPDLVVGVFRFTTAVSARICGIPFCSLACGCMLPGNGAALGFHDGEAGAREQRESLDFFYSFCAASVGPALESFRHPAVTDIRELLIGKYTMLWDFPQFMEVERREGQVHVGPVSWKRWQSVADSPSVEGIGEEVALVSFGTGKVPTRSTRKLVDALLDEGREVVVARGGQPDLAGVLEERPRLREFGYAPMGELLDRAAVIVCHGGQQTVFEALEKKVPVVVMPFQPEQAHNGLCLERLGVGGRLIPPTCYKGGPGAYIDALESMSNREISRRVGEIVEMAGEGDAIEEVRSMLGSLRGAAAVVDTLEEERR